MNPDHLPGPPRRQECRRHATPPDSFQPHRDGDTPVPDSRASPAIPGEAGASVPPAAPFLAASPRIDPSAFVAPGAVVIGDVVIGPRASIWFHAVLRADIERIRIGECSNIQDGCILHLSRSRGTDVGRFVTCGHRAILHACRVEDRVLVGMGAIVMDGAVIGSDSIVGAGALVPQNREIPSGSLVLGSPARVVRALTKAERASIRQSAERYAAVAAEYRDRGQDGGPGPVVTPAG